jgi:hypothetical protein
MANMLQPGRGSDRRNPGGKRAGPGAILHTVDATALSTADSKAALGLFQALGLGIFLCNNLVYMAL